MISRRSVACAIALCALLLSGFATASASASSGLTDVYCRKEVGGLYEASNCPTPRGAGEWETVHVPANESAEVTETAEGSSTFGLTVAGIKIDVICEAMHSTSGSVVNIEKETEMTAHGTNMVFHYTNCGASLHSNPEKKCEVESVSGESGHLGTIETLPLTTVTGAEHKITFKPEEGETLAKFKILKGSCLGATMEIKITGSVIGLNSTTVHARIQFEAATNGGNLKANGASASYTGAQHGVLAGTEETVGLETFE